MIVLATKRNKQLLETAGWRLFFLQTEISYPPVVYLSNALLVYYRIAEVIIVTA